jgi:hypothetical protein
VENVDAASSSSEAESKPELKVDHVILDTPTAIKRNRGPEAGRMAAKVAWISYDLEAREEEEELRAQQAEEGAPEGTAEGGEGRGIGAGLGKYQTKPNKPEDTEVLLRRQHLLELVETVQKFEERLAPKRRFSD